MPITALPTPGPSTADPSTFDARGDALVAALPTFITEANALEVNVNAKEATVVADQILCAASAAIALSASNYKGEWSTLSGAAAVPYAVSHLNKFWMLASNIANIAAKVPGTATEWIEIGNDYSIHEVSEFPDDHTAAGLALLDDADAAAQRTTLGLGTIATQAANNVSISGGTIMGMILEAWPIHEITELCSAD